eukprot:Seg924.10 transcript_id=Seg924.10/GoldUCD/mRNA.D3Y31 product="hypothetical protein" protein_id=Seg924.10/GoldUCD/D3Y31
MERQGRKIAAEKRVFEMSDHKEGKNLSDNIRRRVVDFYCDDEFRREMPGKKDTHLCCLFGNLPKIKNVFAYSSNVEHVLSAVKLDKDRNQIIDLMVCDRESKQCMIHCCANCPPEARVEDYLLQQLKSEGGELQDAASDTMEIEEERIEFQQWMTVDRSVLVRQSLPVTEFVEKLSNLTAHSHIAKSQAKYLKKCKNNLKENEAIIMCDFAFVIQDEV